MTRENFCDGAMLPDFQDFDKVPFPITGPCSSKSEPNISKLGQSDHSDSMSVDLGENEVFINFL